MIGLAYRHTLVNCHHESHKVPCYQGGQTHKETSMNTIIYIVGLIVIIGFILSYFGMR